MPLSIDQARERVLSAVAPLPAQEVALEDALGRVLAADVVAAADVPGFANSAMDGFAIQAGPAGRTLRLVGESRAGAPSDATVGPAEAVRISTGAMMPAGADAVLQLELVREHGDEVTLEADVHSGRNVRGSGEDLPAGATVLTAGAVLGPAELGVAVGAGLASVSCARRPRVVILATGDELVAPGRPLGPGQLHNSNAVTLAALSAQAGAELLRARQVVDDETATATAIAAALADADVVVLTGGVSVGPHDHVKPALAALGVDEVFWRVALRPGRPTWFGTRGPTLVFGLPGNPVSTMVTFLLFVRPALAGLQGASTIPARIHAALGAAMPRHAERDECIRVELRDGVAWPTGPQGSHQLSSMLGADGLGIIPAGDGDLPAGTTIDVELL